MPDLTTAPPWWGESVSPTRQEMAHWLSITSDANRDAYFDARREDSSAAMRCWEMDHEATVERLTVEVQKLRERVRWLEKNYRSSEKKVVRIHNKFPDGTCATDCTGCQP